MPVIGKTKYTLYLDPENVEYLRSKAGDSYMSKGLSGLVDAYLAQVVKLMKASEKLGKRKLTWSHLMEIMRVKTT